MTEPSPVTGACHCGAIRAIFYPSRPLEELEVRSCQCSFCLRHGTKTVSDPSGRARFEIDGAALSWYRFETRTGTSLICGRCGAFAGGFVEDGDHIWSVLNARGLLIPELRDRVGVPKHYDGETTEERKARRISLWTPTEIVWMGVDGARSK